MQKELLSLTELRVIEILDQNGVMTRYQVHQYVKYTDKQGKRKSDIFQKLEDKGLVLKFANDNGTFDRSTYELTEKGKKISRLTKRINRTREEIRHILESQ